MLIRDAGLGVLCFCLGLTISALLLLLLFSVSKARGEVGVLTVMGLEFGFLLVMDVAMGGIRKELFKDGSSIL